MKYSEKLDTIKHLPYVPYLGTYQGTKGGTLKVEAEEVLPRRLEGGIKDFSRLATG